MKLQLSSLIILFLFVQLFSLNLNIHKKSVFDLIPRQNKENFQEYQSMKTKVQVRKTLRNLWDQYNGNWIAKNGKITLLNKYFKTSNTLLKQDD